MSKLNVSPELNVRHRRALWLMLAAAPVAASMTPNAFGANLTWDSGGTTPAAAKDGSGSWNTTAGNTVWSNGILDALWDNASTAVFGNNNGAAGTVTITDPNVTAAGLIFNASGSGAYTIAAAPGSVLTLSGTNPALTINAGVSATISAPIAGAFNAAAGPGIATGMGLVV